MLQRVSDDLDYLGERAALDHRVLLADPDRLAGLKYVFVTAIEGSLNVAQHICAAEGWGPPASNADAFRLLGRHGLLEAGAATSMAEAVGFRNVLVHGYAAVDDGRVVGFLDRLDVLHGFVAAVAQFMAP